MPGLWARCCDAGGGRGPRAGRKDLRAACPEANKHVALRSLPCPQAPRGGAGWSGAERGRGGGAGAGRQRRRRGGRAGGSGVSGPGTGGVGRGAAPNLPLLARTPVMGPRTLGPPVPRTASVAPCDPLSSSCPPPHKPAVFSWLLRPTERRVCAHPPATLPQPPPTPRPLHPHLSPVPPKGRTLPRPASEERGTEGGV